MPHREHTFESLADFAARGTRLREARPVITVGSFDGVHLGHQYLLNELVEWARREHAPSLVLTFRTHPREMMTGREVPALNSAPHKCRLLRRYGVDAILLIEFDETLRSLPAPRFMADFVRDGLNARAMLAGFNNRIGKDGEGTPALLAEIGRPLGIVVREAERIEVSGQAMSSSAIRAHVARGDFLWARKMLGRPYSISGVVQHGDARGRTIGFPTANLSLQGLASPPNGVYGVRVRLDSRTWLGAANIGTRPTVDPARRQPLLEVHLLDFAGDLYGRELEVEFLFSVRAEMKFDGIEALKAQLARDVQEIRTRAVLDEF